MGSSMQHHRVEFEVVEIEPKKWQWIIYPKKSLRGAKVTREVFAWNRNDAIAQCKREIERKLWRQMNAEGR